MKNEICSEKILELFDSGVPINKIISTLHHDFATIKRVLKSKYGDAELKARFKALCAASKIGSRNPMWGKIKEKHHNYVKIQTTLSGYLRTREVPKWYTGANSDGRVLLHILKYCEYNNLTEIPDYMVVHHVDGNKLNNSKENLVLMSIGQHMKHHGLDRARRKEQRLSRKRVDGSTVEAPNDQ